MKTITHVVQIFLDYRRESYSPTHKWVRGRIAFFHRYTLESLLAQTFADFRIFVQCGDANKEITARHAWHPRVEICYDQGRNKYETINTDYLAITRLESDDLFHREAMAEVRDKAILSDQRECLVFRKNLVWDKINGYIMPHTRSSSPFFTHIFPKAIYKDWEIFKAQHFLEQGRAGDRLPATKELSEGKVCVIRHHNNTSLLRRMMTPIVYTGEQRRALFAYDERVILDKARIEKILESFGITGGNKFE